MLKYLRYKFSLSTLYTTLEENTKITLNFTIKNMSKDEQLYYYIKYGNQKTQLLGKYPNIIK